MLSKFIRKLNLNFFSCYFLSLLIFSNVVFAQEYSIEELVNLAKQNSFNIKAAEYQALSQKHLANQQKYWENPVVSFDKISGQKNYSVSQSIPFLGKLQSKYEIEIAQAMALQFGKQNIEILVQAEVFRLLYQYQITKQKIELAQKRLKRLSSVNQYLLHIALNSPTKRAQGIITKDRIKLIERDLMNYQNEVILIWNKLNVYLGLNEEPKIAKVNWFNKSFYKGRDYYVKLMFENNLSLKEQDLLLQKYKSELKYSEIEKMPDLNFSVKNEQISSASMNSNNSNGVGIALSIPLINRNQEKVISVQSKISAQKYEIDFLQSQLRSFITSNLNHLETLMKIAENFPIENIEKSLVNLNSANNDFKKGVLDFITYIELDSQEYQMIETSLDVQYEIANSYSDLMSKTSNFILP